jgi:hypothetical protein
MPDKYDLAIEFLTQNPDKIWDAWNHPAVNEGGCLFMYAHHSTGCLTQIRSAAEDYCGSPLPQIAEIIADERIPERSANITVESLPVFAEWQRKLDAELGPDRNVIPK